uniref:Hypothetical conserved protein n=1 Tax=Acetithermum autotrophicum TaxID=1446466 RepID=H5SQG8_ACEAU|nr:hypothetical conserved protein [Candidatus Acetothermum autotrophicum]
MQSKESRAADKSDWLITKVLPIGSFYPGRSFSVGQVEVNYKPVEPQAAQKALEESKKSFKYEADISSLPRIKVIVRNASQIEALNQGSQLIEEALDVINFCVFDFGDVHTLGIGYMQDLRTKEYYPLYCEDDVVFNNPMFLLDTELDNPYPWNLFRRILEKPKQSRSELEQRVLNAVSWLRQAKFERNTMRELLFRWIALEILLKERTKETVESKALIVIAFPEGEVFNSLGLSIQQMLAKHPKFRPWKKEIEKRFREIQRLRGEIVHQGFKDVELSAAGCRHSLEIYLHLMRMAAGRAIGFACMGIALGYNTVQELWAHKREVFFKQYPDCAHEVLKNVIPILESSVKL